MARWRFVAGHPGGQRRGAATAASASARRRLDPHEVGVVATRTRRPPTLVRSTASSLGLLHERGLPSSRRSVALRPQRHAAFRGQRAGAPSRFRVPLGRALVLLGAREVASSSRAGEVRRQFGAVVGDRELRRSGGVAEQLPEDSQGGVTESHDHVRCCGGQLASESGKVLVDPFTDDLRFRRMRSQVRGGSAWARANARGRLRPRRASSPTPGRCSGSP